MPTWRLSRFWVAAAVVLALPSIALAQYSTVGTIDATFDGDERTWYAVDYTSDARSQHSATIGITKTFTGQIYTIYVQGYPEERPGVEGAFSLSGMFDSLEGCPCDVRGVDAIYFTSSSMVSKVYQAIDMTMTIDSIEPVEDGVYEVSGTFTTLLGWVEGMMQPEPDASRTVEVAGSFVAERVRMRE